MVEVVVLLVIVSVPLLQDETWRADEKRIFLATRHRGGDTHDQGH